MTTTLPHMSLRIRDVMGTVSEHLVHQRSLEAWAAKGLSLLTSSIPANAPIPGPELMRQDLLTGAIVNNWPQLLDQHSKVKVFQLVPRKARNNLALELMRTVILSANSPFTIEHRYMVEEFKLQVKEGEGLSTATQHLEHLKTTGLTEFAQALVQNGYGFDGLLIGPSDAAIFCVTPGSSVTPTALAVARPAAIAHFVRFFLPNRAGAFRKAQGKWESVMSKRLHLFYGTDASSVHPDVAAAAAKAGVHVYVRKGQQLLFLAPAPAAGPTV